MFGFKSKEKCATVVLLAAFLASGAGIAQAQSTRRHRRETNVNRQARIARVVKDTYSHSWEVGGGGGYLRFRSGESLQKNNEVTFWVSTTRYLSPKFGIVGDIRGAYGRAKIDTNPYIKFNPQISGYVDALYFTITTLTTTGFGDITLAGPGGRILAVIIMVVGVGLFLRLLQAVFRPNKVRFECPDCALRLHDADAVHCKHCGRVLQIPDEGL